MCKYLKILKIICLFIAIISCLALTACSNSNSEYTYDDLGVYDTKSQVLLKLGDNRETIEKYIGTAGKEEESFLQTTYCNYGDYIYSNISISDDRELEIQYNQDNIAVAFSLRSCWEEEDNRFELPSGIKITSTVKEFQEAYPQFEEKNIDGLYDYASELHLKLANDVFETGSFTKDDYEFLKKNSGMKP